MLKLSYSSTESILLVWCPPTVSTLFPRATWVWFHQGFTSSLYARRSQKCKNTTLKIFTKFWHPLCEKHVDKHKLLPLCSHKFYAIRVKLFEHYFKNCLHTFDIKLYRLKQKNKSIKSISKYDFKSIFHCNRLDVIFFDLCKNEVSCFQKINTILYFSKKNLYKLRKISLKSKMKWNYYQAWNQYSTHR